MIGLDIQSNEAMEHVDAGAPRAAGSPDRAMQRSEPALGWVDRRAADGTRECLDMFGQAEEIGVGRDVYPRPVRDVDAKPGKPERERLPADEHCTRGGAQQPQQLLLGDRRPGRRLSSRR